MAPLDPQRAGPRRRCPVRQRQRRVADGPGIQGGRGGGKLPANLGPDPRMLRQPRRVQATVFSDFIFRPGAPIIHTGHRSAGEWFRRSPPEIFGQPYQRLQGTPLEPPLSRPPGLPGLGKPVPTERPGPSHRERDHDNQAPPGPRPGIATYDPNTLETT